MIHYYVLLYNDVFACFCAVSKNALKADVHSLIEFCLENSIVRGQISVV